MNSRSLFDSPSILPITTHPFPDESFQGYLCRVSERYSLGRIGTLLNHLGVKGESQRLPSAKHLDTMSNYLGIDANILNNLGGFSRNRIEGEEYVKIGMQWVRKNKFVSYRYQQVCPTCLRQARYIRDYWALGFYCACHVHGCKMLRYCPNCGHSIHWMRTSVGGCQCGSDYVHAESLSAPPEVVRVSEFIYTLTHHQHSEYPPLFHGRAIGGIQSQITLDVFLSVIWFLGICIPELVKGQCANSRKKYMGQDAQKSVQEAISYCQYWPDSLFESIDQAGNWAPRGITGPISSFIRTHLEDDRLAGLISAIRFYEQQRRFTTRRHLLNPNQLELHFEPQ